MSVGGNVGDVCVSVCLYANGRMCQLLQARILKKRQF